MTNWAVQLISIVSFVFSGLPTPNFHVVEGIWQFLSCHADFRTNTPPKMSNSEISWISRRDRVGFSNCLDLFYHYTTILPGSVLIYSDGRDTTLRTFIRAGIWVTIISWQRQLYQGRQGGGVHEKKMYLLKPRKHKSWKKSAVCVNSSRVVTILV